MGAGGSSVRPSSVCTHFIQCIVTAAERRESDLQVHIVEVACSHIQSLWVFVLERANSLM